MSDLPTSATLWPALIPASLDDKLDLVASRRGQGPRVGRGCRLAKPLGPHERPRPGRGRLAAAQGDGQRAHGSAQRRLQSPKPNAGRQHNPFAFSSATTAQQLIFNFQLPLNRLVERSNAYRTAIINYQIARRSLMGLEDSIAAQVRFDVRQLQLFAENYRIQKKVIAIAILPGGERLGSDCGPGRPRPTQNDRNGCRGQRRCLDQPVSVVPESVRQCPDQDVRHLAELPGDADAAVL